MDDLPADPGSKTHLRRERLAARSALADRPGDDRARAALLLADPLVRAAGCVMSYVSVGAEPDTTPVHRSLRAAGVRLLLPRLRPDGGIDCVPDGPLAPGRYGIPAPRGPAVDPAAADLWLVPALAVDRRGVRLGRGGGHYDRVLPADRPVLALLHAGELVDALPAEAHDRRVTHAAGPTYLVALRPLRRGRLP